MIQKSHIIDPSKYNHEFIVFGSSVSIVDLDSGEVEHYTICGVTESEPEIGLISIHSPIAKAILGKRVDDQINVKLPNIVKEYEILKISYKNIFSLKNNIKSQKQFVIH